MFNKRIKIKKLLAQEPNHQEVTVMGWVRTFRNNQFIALNDGSTNNNLQVVAQLGKFDDELLKRITTSASLKVTGTIVPSLGKGQKMDLQATSIEILGDSDAEAYPLQPKKHSLEFLRERAHLRFRTKTFGSVFRIRHTLAFAVHKFFNDKGFVYLQTPIITGSDAEGAGEMFKVTSLNLENIPFKNDRFDKAAENYYNRLIDSIEIEKRNVLIGKINSLLKKIDSELTFKKIVLGHQGFIQNLSKKKEELQQLKPQFKELYSCIKETDFFEIKSSEKTKKRITYFPTWFLENINPSKIKASVKRVFGIKEGFDYLCLSYFNFEFIVKELRNSKERKVDFKEDFFGRATNLTVSGQLEGELGATAFGEIYTFGPTFRAENSNTKRHLAEFWMIEPEMAFHDLEDNMILAEDFIKYLIRYVIENNKEDLESLAQRFAEEESYRPQNERSEMGLIEKLEFVLNNRFERLTYTDAINILKESSYNKKKKFQYEITGWGMDLQSEHERYLVEKQFKKPVILTNYPAAIKAFYMRMDDNCEPNRQTVSAMDILAPGIGEIVGGSQREERLGNLEARMKEMHIPTEELQWYLDTRRFGTVPHAGFGLGFERMVQFVTGMTNIRDVIAFPRTPGSAEF